LLNPYILNRIDRLTAILVQLQSKRVVKAEEIADRFEISLRTVYRDVRALMEAGVPIGSEAGKGYFIVDGYYLPPVMFTQDEANAMLLAGKLVEKLADQSIAKAFESSLFKIKSVLDDTHKDRLDYLQSHVAVYAMPGAAQSEFPNNFLSEIQRAVIANEVLQIEYFSGQHEVTNREVEPIGLFYYSAAWHLIGYCRLRDDYRDFRTDRIKSLVSTGNKFEARKLKSIKDYIQQMMSMNEGLERAVIVFDKSVTRYISQQKYQYGLVSEEDLGDKVRMIFLTGYLDSMARWMLLMGQSAEVESPETLKTMVRDNVKTLYQHLVEKEAASVSDNAH
jgi:predicted DNA-binding transcriptional regulator YafY